MSFSLSLIKKICAFVLCAFSLLHISAFSPDEIHTYTLENGLHLYVLSDPATATIRAELDIYAGYSAQTEKTAGFFPLYVRLLSETVGEADMGADCVRLVRTTSPLALEETLATLSYTLRPLAVTDTQLRTALSAMKQEVTDYASSPAGFINTAIDARVFSQSPWKQESGVYPALFTATTVQGARTVLESLAAVYYSAWNASLFLSGNITDSEALALASAAFSGVRSVPVTRAAVPAQPDTPAVRKFVLADSALSADMAQIVMQYVDFTRDQADVLAAAYNDDSSPFKKSLIQEETLGIRGAEYVNVASAQKKDSSRLIVQALLEKTKTAPCAQAEQFVRIVEDAAYLDEDVVQRASRLFEKSFARHALSSASLMELVASYVAANDASVSAASLFARDKSLLQLSTAELRSLQRLQTPYVFVLVHDSVYKKHSAAFKKAGYELVTQKNGSWYTQSLYAALLESADKGISSEAENDVPSMQQAADRFIEQSSAGIASFALSNKIPVWIKRENAAGRVSLMLGISGGDLLFADKAPGLCALLTDALSLSIRREVPPDCEITAETFATYSRICITCSADDFEACVRGINRALIYRDITPAMADGIAYDERTHWRLKTGTTTFQLLCEAVRSIYASPYTKLFNDKDDKPSLSIDFTRIASSYPLLLDASRYTIVAVGALPEDAAVKALLEESVGVLGSQKATESKEKKLSPGKFPKKAKRVSLRHLFLTDISADKAGPRPQVLVPTKNFADPVLYCLTSPDLASTDSALYAALLYELTSRLQAKLGSEMHVSLELSDDDVQFSRIYVSNVTKTARVDRLYAEVVRSLKDDIEKLVSAADKSQPLLHAMENRWVLEMLSETGATEETVCLMHTGIFRAQDPLLYAKQYAAVHAATALDYYIVAQAYLDEIPAFRLYSADAK